jgi:hypothetical protein
MGSELSRRDVLRYGATAAGVGAVGALSGCGAISGLLGGGAIPSYAGWLPAPDEISDDDHYRFNSINTAELRDAESERDEINFDYFLEPSSIEYEFFGLAPEDIDEWVHLSPMVPDSNVYNLVPTVMSGDFEKGDVTDALDDLIDERDADVSTEAGGGYTHYSTESNEGDVAVTEGTLIFGPESGSADFVETIIDTEHGDVDRYVDVNEDMNALVDTLGEGTIVMGSTMDPVEETYFKSSQYHWFEEQVAYGIAIEIDGASADYDIVVVFNSERDVDMDAVGNLTESDTVDGFFQDVSTSRTGRIVSISATIDTKDLSFQF